VQFDTDIFWWGTRAAGQESGHSGGRPTIGLKFIRGTGFLFEMDQQNME
jgi:hypothetical protein